MALVSIVMCALLPRILRFKILAEAAHDRGTPQSAHELTATPQIDRTEMTVRNPLLLARTCRDGDERRKLRPSSDRRTRA